MFIYPGRAAGCIPPEPRSESFSKLCSSAPSLLWHLPGVYVYAQPRHTPSIPSFLVYSRRSGNKENHSPVRPKKIKSSANLQSRSIKSNRSCYRIALSTPVSISLGPLTISHGIHVREQVATYLAGTGALLRPKDLHNNFGIIFRTEYNFLRGGFTPEPSKLRV